MYTKRDLEDLTWHIPPSCAGQAVEVAYAVDPAGLFRRITDQSLPSTDPERVEYAWVSWDQFDDGGEAAGDPWNHDPGKDVDDDMWVELD